MRSLQLQNLQLVSTQELLSKTNFSKGKGLIPAIIQDDKTQKVLMLGYMNAKALKQTIKSNTVTFYSRSKKRLWVKGETSGNFLKVKDIKLDCDKDALLVKVKPIGPVCHKGTDTCWSEKNKKEGFFLEELEQIVQRRKKKPDPSSYTSKLIQRGINKVAQKVGEEAVEVVIESKDEDEDLFNAEVADLMYHLTVLLAIKDSSWKKVMKTLKERRR